MSRGGGGSNSACSIFVGNLPYDAEEDELKELFSRAGHVTSIRVVCDRDTKQPKGYAFCDFTDSESVQIAIEKLHGAEYRGRKLRIDGAERELTGGGGGGGGGREDRPSGPPRGGRDGPSADAPTAPVQTIAEKMAQMQSEQDQAKARVAAAEQAERAEVGRLMETLTPQQVLHILGETQRLALRAPEVARALIGENMQLALALQHAEFLAGLVEEPPVPTDPEVKESAKNIRERVFGVDEAPMAKRHAPGQPQQVMQQQAMQQAGMHYVTGMAAPAGVTMTMPHGAVPFGAMPQPVFAPGTMTPPGMPVTMASPGMQATAAPMGADPVLGQLAQLSPAQIDQLPHDQKVKLLSYLQQLPQGAGRR